MIEEATIEVGAGKMPVLVATPEKPGAYPALVIAHHRDGVDEFTRKVAERLAENGFIAAAPSLYHRRPDDEPRAESRKKLDDTEVAADLARTIDHLVTIPTVRTDAIGIIGHCMGGRMSFLGAASDKRFKAAVVLYGGNIFVPEGKDRPAPIALAPNIRCAVAGFFGRDDTNPSPDDVERISQTLQRHGIRHDFRIYDGAGHAFQNFSNLERYHEQVSEDAWSRLLAFLHAELAPKG